MIGYRTKVLIINVTELPMDQSQAAVLKMINSEGLEGWEPYWHDDLWSRSDTKQSWHRVWFKRQLTSEERLDAIAEHNKGG